MFPLSIHFHEGVICHKAQINFYRCKSFSKNDQLFTGFHFPRFIQKCSNHTTTQQKITNYKPISNLSFLSKIFEEMFIKKLNEYL